MPHSGAPPDCPAPHESRIMHSQGEEEKQDYRVLIGEESIAPNSYQALFLQQGTVYIYIFDFHSDVKE